MTPSCLKCGAAYELEIPDIWVKRHPELKGACPECAALGIPAPTAAEGMR